MWDGDFAELDGLLAFLPALSDLHLGEALGRNPRFPTAFHSGGLADLETFLSNQLLGGPDDVRRLVSALTGAECVRAWLPRDCMQPFLEGLLTHTQISDLCVGDPIDSQGLPGSVPTAFWGSFTGLTGLWLRSVLDTENTSESLQCVAALMGLTSLTLIDDGRRDPRVTLAQLMPLTALTWLLQVQITGFWGVQPWRIMRSSFLPGFRRWAST